ncbi:hypothetical protein HanRHA438_Chr09g0375451 [Helianthus annuus]|uniref:Uncharacterized protein n=1 Tax=Helianthus annuus TaxID=4232 RepID=A0A9K3I2K5_HELAN|nr:hypothetical protein HanXRQr2_Chr09g0363851 [Helianthus annuus]KAJ0886100.1 hypothetical protein HanRHA438_Chr09g0375451 [Helianthus annuus]KAJ0891219.1 hypothetical protein HanPSC8_Chr09g0351031 [Helianthus annuus]
MCEQVRREDLDIGWALVNKKWISVVMNNVLCCNCLFELFVS